VPDPLAGKVRTHLAPCLAPSIAAVDTWRLAIGRDPNRTVAWIKRRVADIIPGQEWATTQPFVATKTAVEDKQPVFGSDQKAPLLIIAPKDLQNLPHQNKRHPPQPNIA
jgi:hypothetical protein